MARRFFRKLMPSRNRLEREKAGWLTRFISHPRAWHLNRHSVSRGLAIGMFWAWIPIPMQTPFACFFSWKLKGNVPLAFACCWVSNPLTMLPAIWLCYHIGLFVTWSEPTGFLDEIKRTMTRIEHEGFLTGIRSFFGFMWQNLGMVYPFLVGSLVFSSLNAVIVFFGAHALWRWNLVRRWRKRGHWVHCRECHRPLPMDRKKECPFCGSRPPHQTRIGLGLAAVARLAQKRPLTAKSELPLH